ncbi:hypothetical protein EWM64_g7368 [Hericium alpestre]|uniref:Uncharacterized protein n=1 Tax=Hericium alpestre TaxID=135208 RepID=A0A4Y9ZQW5_9AGAM|nr:hypothetical protein EWM64_g7368 [Hericium alpestre]
MTAFPLDEAHIIVLFLQSLFYGIYLITFVQCINVLWFNRRRKGVPWPFTIVLLLLFIFATLDLALSLRFVLIAFIWYKGPGGATQEFLDVSSWVNVMQTVCYTAQTSIADAMLIYRCYIIYGRSRTIVSGLCLLWVACIGCEIAICYFEITLKRHADLGAHVLRPFIISVLAITLVLNLIATFLIKPLGGPPLHRAIRIVVESGAMYTASVLVFTVTYLANNYSQYPVSDSIVEIIGIAFNLIIIRVEQGRSVETLQTQSLAARPHPRENRPVALSTIRFDTAIDVDTSVDQPSSSGDSMDKGDPHEHSGVRFTLSA